MAAYKYYITRMHSLPLTQDRKQKEWTIIQHTARASKRPNPKTKFPVTTQVKQG
jgi:hypothetical protein